MSGWFAYGPVAVAVLLGCFELRPAGRRHASGPGRRLAAFAALLGAALAVLAPFTIACVDRVLPGWSAALHLAGRELEMAALSLLPGVPVRLGMRPVRGARRSLHLALTAAAMSTCLVLFSAAGAEVTGAAVTAEGRGWVALALSGTVFTGYSLWCLICFALPVLAHARALPPGATRLGFRLIGGAAGVGLLWGLWGIAGIANMVREQRQGAGQDPVAVLLGTGCLVLAAAGASTVWWTSAVASWARRLRAARELRTLAVLWSALHSVLPSTALPTAGAARGRGWRGTRDAEFALYRRIVEIRDGCLALSRYVPEQAAEWAGTGLKRFPPYGADVVRATGSCRKPGPGAGGGARSRYAVRSAYTGAAVAEAAVLAAAIEAVRAGHAPRSPASGAAATAPGATPRHSPPAGLGSPGIPPDGAGDGEGRGGDVFAGTVEAEAAWLCRVAEAFEHSRAVEYVRSRAHQEFAARDAPVSGGHR
ncbi:MAB_1171c family putative transporter [Streptomyces sp. NPDC000134]|uniref:MAB_1171c family putative transporter n=1 Tax=Streptomyces sp. NPDC000134 TaxID=3364536 RepID=UPI0036C38FB1